MDKRTLISLIIGAVLLIGAGIAGYLIRGGCPPPEQIVHRIELPADTIDAPAKIITVRVPDPALVASQQETIDAQEAEIARLRAEREQIMAKIARYEQTWAVLDTNLTQSVHVLTENDSVVATERFTTHMQLRYGYPPINRFIVLRPTDRITVRIPLPPSVMPERAGETWFASAFGWIRDAFAVVGLVAVAAGTVYVTTR